jgi:hypothetical protein
MSCRKGCFVYNTSNLSYLLESAGLECKLRQHTAMQQLVTKQQYGRIATTATRDSRRHSSLVTCSSKQQEQRLVAPTQQQHSRRDFLQLIGFGAAGLAAAVMLPVPIAQAAATTAVSSSKALEEYMKLEDDNKLRDQRSLDNIRYAAACSCVCSS